MLATAKNINGLSFYMAPPYKLSFGKLTDEQFETVCRHHPDLKFELTAKGELIIVPPTLPDTGWRNSRLNTRIDIWSLETKSGIVLTPQQFSLSKTVQNDRPMSLGLLVKNGINLLTSKRKNFQKLRLIL